MFPLAFSSLYSRMLNRRGGGGLTNFWFFLIPPDLIKTPPPCLLIFNLHRGLCLCTAQVSRFSRISRMRTSYSYITPLRRYLSWYLGGAGAYNTIFKIQLLVKIILSKNLNKKKVLESFFYCRLISFPLFLDCCLTKKEY